MRGRNCSLVETMTPRRDHVLEADFWKDTLTPQQPRLDEPVAHVARDRYFAMKMPDGHSVRARASPAGVNGVCQPKLPPLK